MSANQVLPAPLLLPDPLRGIVGEWQGSRWIDASMPLIIPSPYSIDQSHRPAWNINRFIYSTQAVEEQEGGPPIARAHARGRICVKVQSSQVNKQLLLPVRETRVVRFVRLLQEWRTGGGDEPPPIPPHLLSASPMAGDAGTHSSLYKCGWEFGKYQSLHTKGMHRFKTCQDHEKDVF